MPTGVGRRLAADLLADGADNDDGELVMTRARKTAGRITFVGAGPGDPGLLTVHAVDALQRADVVYRRRRPCPTRSARSPRRDRANRRGHAGRDGQGAARRGPHRRRRRAPRRRRCRSPTTTRSRRRWPSPRTVGAVRRRARRRARRRHGRLRRRAGRRGAHRGRPATTSDASTSTRSRTAPGTLVLTVAGRRRHATSASSSSPTASSPTPRSR